MGGRQGPDGASARARDEDWKSTLPYYAALCTAGVRDGCVGLAEVRSRGLDINIAGNLTPEWRVIGGYAYVDAEVTESSSASMPAGTRRPLCRAVPRWRRRRRQGLVGRVQGDGVAQCGRSSKE